ncbi:tRNA pseudouridine(38-40) synthase TruA [Candidatus Cardinium sp. cBcalN1]|nr:tRNA pseudouridine(38-40) synthase TruA [Candidatus Cardinium sp. cBcalN1]
MRYFIYIAYLGKAYSGWQVQKNALAVQQVVEEALGKVLSMPITISGSSRTDKGVHAQQQVAHFDLIRAIDPSDLIYRLNRILPSDISITAIRPVIDGAHARFDASYRTYHYTIVIKKNPFYKDHALWLCRMPPLVLLNEITTLFCLTTDFEFFSKKADTDFQKNAHGFVCDVKEANWLQIDQSVIFQIKANRFLRGMVRVIVSTILKVAIGKMDLAALAGLIREKPPIRPILSLMPAHGLTLMEVGYPETLFIP